MENSKKSMNIAAWRSSSISANLGKLQPQLCWMWKISKQVLEVAACTFMWLFVCPSVDWSVVLLHVWRGKCDGKRQRAWGIVHNERETKSLLNFISCFQSRFATPNSKMRMRFMHWYKIGHLFLYHYTCWITLLVSLSKLNSLGEGLGFRV